MTRPVQNPALHRTGGARQRFESHSADVGRTLHTVEDILAAASLLAGSEIVRLQEGLLRLAQERNKPRPSKASKKK